MNFLVGSENCKNLTDYRHPLSKNFSSCMAAEKLAKRHYWPSGFDVLGTSSPADRSTGKRSTAGLFIDEFTYLLEVDPWIAGLLQKL